MSSNLSKYKDDLLALIKMAHEMNYDNSLTHIENENGHLSKQQLKQKKIVNRSFIKNYQSWYTESCAVIKQILPNRLTEFEQLYKGDGKRKTIDVITYHIQDWLNGIRSPTNEFGENIFDDFVRISMLFRTQLGILESLESRFESSLFDIKQLVQADLFDSELDAARELVRHGFLRGAGAISGVVLEKHLAQVLENHNLKTRKKNPTISIYNELLKEDGVLDIPSWRQIQRLGDIRNFCDHNKERPPTKDEVEELINGVDKFTKSLF